MKFDLHCHTKEGSIDAKISIEEYVKKLITLGYDGMLVTDHNSYRGYERWKEVADSLKKSKPFTVLRGIEYDTRNGGHMIAVLPEKVSAKILETRGMTVAQVEKVVHMLGGILGPAHPYGTGYFALMHTHHIKKNPDLIKKFDFIETFNAATKPLANKRAELLARKYGKVSFSGSDAHKDKHVGSAFTIIDREIRNTDDLIHFVREHGSTITGGTVTEKVNGILGMIAEKIGIAGYWIYNKTGAALKIKSRREIFRELSAFFEDKHWYKEHKRGNVHGAI